MSKSTSVVDSVKQILSGQFVGGQEELRNELATLGYDVTQATVSRALKKLGAVRSYTDDGQVTYVLPSEESLPPVNATIMDLVQTLESNENMIVIRTKPGSASLIARHIDYHAETVLGTVAGDDCFFVVPASTKKIKATIEEVSDLLGVKP